MSNYPPGVTDADIDYHFGGHDEPDAYGENFDDREPEPDEPEGLGEFLERERAIAYYERYERQI